MRGRLPRCAVLDGEGGYLRRLEYKRDKQAEKDAALSRKAMLQALAASARGEVPEDGPRGGWRWSGRLAPPGVPRAEPSLGNRGSHQCNPPIITPSALPAT